VWRVLAASALFLFPGALFSQTPQPQQQSSTPQPQLPPPPIPRPAPPLAILVIDPAHGATDSGARGEQGVAEKDVVLFLAQSLKRELERQGMRVILTRQGDTAASFDDRASIANVLPNAVFLSLHVSSTGKPGIATAYSQTPPMGTMPERRDPGAPVPWEEAQLAFIADSRRLAEFLQIQLAQKFPGSPESPSSGNVRQLRLVTHPAVAIELSSVDLPDAKPLERMAPGLAESISRALAAFRQTAGAAKP
jgi:N-acetylmuramoyl-L-alanine amidase